MVTRILHVSDLHFGALDDPEAERALTEIVARTEPEVVLASGDLTHRGRPDQHQRAAAFLRAPGIPVVAVPGNHDIPYTFPARFTSPWRVFEQEWTTTEPVLSNERVHIVGINSVRPWHHQSGGIGDEALARAAARLREAQPGALRIVVLHHQLIGAPWRTRKKPVAHRDQVLARLADADLIVGGHIHQATVSERREFEVDAGRLVVSIAPGFGRPRPQRTGEARGAMVYTIDEQSLGIETLIWNDGWTAVATRTFAR